MRETTKEPMDVFISKIEQARLALSRIEEALDDHLGFRPEEINWGHVGAAPNIAGTLTDTLSSVVSRRQTPIDSFTLQSSNANI